MYCLKIVISNFYIYDPRRTGVLYQARFLFRLAIERVDYFDNLMTKLLCVEQLA